MQATSFGQERIAAIAVGDTQLYTGKLPTGGAFATMQTGVRDWPAGITEVYITADGPAVTPKSLDPKQKEHRPLTVGATGLKLEVVP